MSLTKVTNSMIRGAMVNVLDYGAVIGGESTAAFQAAIVAANGGAVYIPDGTYLVSKVGTQGTWLVGQSRDKTIIKCNTAQASTTYVLDQALNRDGVTPNTSGGGGFANLTVDCASKAFVSGIRTYGGGVVVENLIVKNGVDGVTAGLPIWASFRNIYSFSHTGRGFFTYSGAADNGTSTTFENCWADLCGTYGFHVTQLFYSSFLNCVSQGCTNYGWFVEGNTNGLTACYSLQFIGCANEGGAASAFYFKRLRDCTIIAPRIITAAANAHLITLDDCTGTVQDYSYAGTPSAGYYLLNPINTTGGTGSIKALGGAVTYNPASAVATDAIALIGPSYGRFQNTKADSYTLTLEDGGKTLVLSAGAGKTFTIPASAAVYYPVGTEIVFVNRSGSALSIAITTDTMLLANTFTAGTRTLATQAMAVARKVEGSVWIIGSVGGGLT